jgi:hypothetical protein
VISFRLAGCWDQCLRKKKPQSALADWGKVIGPNLQATAPGVAELTAAKSGCSSATGAQLRLVRAHIAVAAIIVMRFFWPAVLMLFAFAGVNLGLSLENERRSFRDIKHYMRRKHWLG